MFEKYDAYKDSGLESFPEIPKNWQLKKLKFLLDEVNIRSETGDETLLSLSKYKGVIPKDSLDERAGSASTLVGYKKVFKHNLVINKMQAVNGLLAVSELEGITSPDYSVYSAKDNSVNIHYIAFLLNQPEYLAEMKKRVTGVMEGFIRLYTDDLYDIKAILPSIKEQNCIVDFLQKKLVEIDQAIAIKEQQIALLNERKQIVIQKAVTQGLDPNVPMKDSGVEWIGQIPEHWKIKKLKFICKSQGRIGFKGYSSDDLVEANEGALTLGATHLNWNGEIILDQPVYLNWKKYYESPEIMVKKDDILIVQRGSTCGKVAIVDKDYGEVTINPSLVLLKEFRENPYFCVESIKVVLNGILNEVSKTAIPMISQFQINNIQIALPPLEEQVFIVKKVQEVTAQYSEINKFILDEIIRLKEYKTTLINDAVTGKIKVA